MLKPLRPQSKQNSIDRLLQRLFKPVDNSPLIIFRIAFGFLLCWHVISFIKDGKVYELFTRVPFTFTFIGFEFLHPLPGNGMYVYFFIMAFLAVMIMTGAWYRFAMVGFTIMWTAIYLMQKVDYNNHYYLVTLLCFLMCFMPARRYYSIDVKRKAVAPSTSCPQWVTWMFIAQMGIVYFYAATSKLTVDWLSGRFIAYRFSGLATHHHIGFIYGSSLFQFMLVYGGIAFDLLVVPLLLWKKTRPYAFAASCLFHLFNSVTFHIGIFPFLSIALNIFFFTPGEIRNLFFKTKPPLSESMMVNNTHSSKWIVYGCGIYLIFQMLIPLRFLLYPGNVFWTEEGYKMSWKMMLRVKTGEVKFKILDSASNYICDIDPVTALSPMYAYWLATSPDMMWQYAQRLKKDYAAKGYKNIQVYAISAVRLNGRTPLPLVNPQTNLAAIEWKAFAHSDWIMKGPAQ